MHAAVSGFRPTDDTAGDTASRIASGLTAIVGFFMDDDTASEDGIFAPVDRDVVHKQAQDGFALGIGLEIAKIAGVSHGLLGKGVLVSLRVVVTARTGAVRRSAIPKLMDMNRMHRIGRETLYRPADAHLPSINSFKADNSTGLISLGVLQYHDSRSWFLRA